MDALVAKQTNKSGPMDTGKETPIIQVAISIECPAWVERMSDVTEVASRVSSAVLAVGVKPNTDARAKPEVEISLLLTDDQTVRRLNAQYRERDEPTNVLAFPGGAGASPLSGDLLADGPPPVVALGDVVLAFEAVERESIAQSKNFSDHATHLMVHGILHLLGHDHESEEEAIRMESLEVTILRTLGIADPYQEKADVAQEDGPNRRRAP